MSLCLCVQDPAIVWCSESKVDCGGYVGLASSFLLVSHLMAARRLFSLVTYVTLCVFCFFLSFCSLSLCLCPNRSSVWLLAPCGRISSAIASEPLIRRTGRFAVWMSECVKFVQPEQQVIDSVDQKQIAVQKVSVQCSVSCF